MTPKELVEAFAAAVAAVDGDRVAELFAKDGVYHDLVYGPVSGRAEIKDLFERVRRSGRDYRFDMQDTVYSEGQAYARYRFSFTAHGAPYDGRRVAVEGMARFAFADGLIKDYREAANQGVTLVQLGMPPDKIERALRRWAVEMLSEPGMQWHL